MCFSFTQDVHRSATAAADPSHYGQVGNGEYSGHRSVLQCSALLLQTCSDVEESLDIND